jgi:hypothetical protein
MDFPDFELYKVEEIAPTMQHMNHSGPTSRKTCKLIHKLIKCVHIWSHVIHVDVFCQIST